MGIKSQSKMTVLSIVLSSFLLAMVNSQAVEKAASPYTNIGCQCSSLTFVDSSGHIQTLGLLYHYKDSHHSSCQDLVYSARFPNNPWSYEACATPAVIYNQPLTVPAYTTGGHHHHHVSKPVYSVG